MNGSQIIKRIVPVLIVILLIVGAAVLASALNKEKAVPSITDEDGIYLTINEGERSYSISKKYMYDELKSNVGLRTLLDKLDRYLLEKQTKDESNYFASVSEEEVDEALEKAIFPSGKENLSEEDITKAENEYYRSLYISAGLRTKDEVKNYHRLTLAKKAYAYDMLLEEIARVDKLAEEDETLDPYFTQTLYEAKYKTKYLTSYWTIIIPFVSETEAKYALKQVGLKVNSENKLVKISDEDVLATPTEIALAYIEMYNTYYARFNEDFPESRLTLKEGIHYRIDAEDGKLIFNSVIEEDEEMNRLHLSSEDVVKINKQIENYLKTNMQSYASSSDESSKWYTPDPRAYDGKVYAYILKIKEEQALELEAVKDEVFKLLVEEELDDNYITKKIIELYELNNLKIFDADLEKQYISYVESFDLNYKKIKEENKTTVATVTGLEITADQLFKDMDNHFGSSLVASEVNFLRFLNSLELNKIYDYYTKNISAGKRVLNKDKWEEIRNATIGEKNRFLAGEYTDYPPNYGWKNFLRDKYGVTTVEDLMYTLLYQKLRSDYASSLLKIEDLTAESEEWQKIVKQMEKIEEDYFSVNGIQLLISVKDIDGKYVPEAKWSDIQRQYAEELYGNVWKYIGAEAGNYDEKLNNLVTKFKDAPRFLASLAQNVNVQPEIEGNPYIIEEEGSYKIEVSKYKTVGLNIEFLRISSLTNASAISDTTPEALKEAAKEIFKSLPAGSTQEVRYGYSYGSDDYDYLISKTGYHVYINTSIVDLATWNYTDDEEKHILPTLEMIKTVAKDNAAKTLLDEEGNKTDIELTAAMKTAIGKYFEPIKYEITGTINLSVILYKQMQEISLDFKVNNYSNEEFNTFLNKIIEIYVENLQYINAEE